MATTLKTDVFNPEILTEAVQAAFAQRTAFMGSRLTSLGIAVVSGSMPIAGAPTDAIGTTITMPYWGTLGEFASNAEGSSVTPSKIAQITETATVTRDSLAFEVSRWAQANSVVNPNVGDPYEESARQIMAAAERAMDKRLITAAANSGNVYVKDVYSATTPQLLNWDLCVDAKFEGWGDEQDNISALLVHSHAHKDLLKLKDSTGRPLLLQSQTEGGPVDTFCGVPVVVSDRVPVTGSTMTSVAASGTTPPTVTLSGTPLGAFKLQIDIVVGGGAGTATFRFSTDNGNTWSATLVTPAGGGNFVLTDTNVDSLVGANGLTGITANFGNATYNADNLYTSNSSLKVMSLIFKRRALSFWYSSAHLGMETDKDIMKHTDLAAMHLYGAAHRYRRLAGGTKAGVVQIVHNVSGFS